MVAEGVIRSNLESTCLDNNSANHISYCIVEVSILARLFKVLCMSSAVGVKARQGSHRAGRQYGAYGAESCQMRSCLDEQISTTCITDMRRLSILACKGIFDASSSRNFASPESSSR